MILGVGLVSLATLFPLGLLRLRDAARYSRSAYLTESAAADARRGRCSAAHVVQHSRLIRYELPATTTRSSRIRPLTAPTGPQTGQAPAPTQDTPGLGLRARLSKRLSGNPALRPTSRWPTYATLRRARAPVCLRPALAVSDRQPGNDSGESHRLLHRAILFEARFGSGIGFIRSDPLGTAALAQRPRPAAAHQLQRPVRDHAMSIGPDHAGFALRPQHLRLAARTWSGRSRPVNTTGRRQHDHRPR